MSRCADRSPPSPGNDILVHRINRSLTYVHPLAYAMASQRMVLIPPDVHAGRSRGSCLSPSARGRAPGGESMAPVRAFKVALANRFPAACTPRLIPRAGGGRPFNGDLHPLNGELELDPLVDACEVNDYPVLIPHGGDAMAFRNGSAGAGGRVIAAEVLELGQMVDVAGRLDPADAYITNG